MDEQKIAWVARKTDPSGLVTFLFTAGPRHNATNWSTPKIASGRWTRARLAAYWSSGFVLVPPTILAGAGWEVEIGPNQGYRVNSDDK